MRRHESSVDRSDSRTASIAGEGETGPRESKRNDDCGDSRVGGEPVRRWDVRSEEPAARRAREGKLVGKGEKKMQFDFDAWLRCECRARKCNTVTSRPSTSGTGPRRRRTRCFPTRIRSPTANARAATARRSRSAIPEPAPPKQRGGRASRRSLTLSVSRESWATQPIPRARPPATRSTTRHSPLPHRRNQQRTTRSARISVALSNRH